ncbi:hypothetical protein AB0K18_30105 [Nonomuraea sp. NPDC049421]|uniref:hypothetical protein n=1 Tax=Nonomuraea sp. NPDC049421 TaxID=3155275 RepID=UPI003415DF38
MIVGGGGHTSLRRSGDGARAVSVFWNVDAMGRLMYAAYGTVVTEVDRHRPGEPWGKTRHACC